MRLCSNPGRELRRAQAGLGTIVEITVPRVARAHAAVTAAFSAIAAVERLMSAHDAGSDLGRLYAAPRGAMVAVHAWTWRVLAAAQSVCRRTKGAFDPAAAGSFAAAAGRLPSWPGRLPGRDARLADLELLSGHRVCVHQRVRLDLGGIAKGFAVDRAVQRLRAAGMCRGLVNAGGDLRAFGDHAWPLHVRHPAAPGELVSLGTLRNGAAATSAPYFSADTSAGRPASALVHPATGRRLDQAISATVFAPTCMTADALTKAVLLRPDRDALRGFRARAVVLATRETFLHAA